MKFHGMITGPAFYDVPSTRILIMISQSTKLSLKTSLPIPPRRNGSGQVASVIWRHLNWSSYVPGCVRRWWRSCEGQQSQWHRYIWKMCWPKMGQKYRLVEFWKCAAFQWPSGDRRTCRNTGFSVVSSTAWVFHHIFRNCLSWKTWIRWSQVRCCWNCL